MVSDTERTCIAIDLKSFYASVECRERGLDPLTTNLVVANEERTEKTICLAVSPSLRARGIPGRARLFEVAEQVGRINNERRRALRGAAFSGSSCSSPELDRDPTLRLGYIIAKPRMAYYMQYSTRIYGIYKRFVAPEDIHVYSVDEVFIDASAYLKTYRMNARELAMEMIRTVLTETGITATAGIGPNLYLAKIAMDLEAKRIEPDRDGVRIAELDLLSYREKYWDHRPLTDFWRVGPGSARRLESHGIFTMGDIARCSLDRSSLSSDLLFRLFGVNAELLIDHAWGEEPCTIADIKAYRPEENSIGTGQVLPEPYPNEKARLIVWEMADALALDLVRKQLVTERISLQIGYDIENLSDPERGKAYRGKKEQDRYGRTVPASVHGTEALPRAASSSRLITEAAVAVFDRITDPALTIRRMNLTALNAVRESAAEEQPEQLSIFSLGNAAAEARAAEEQRLNRERRGQEVMLRIREKYGKNAILKGKNLEEGATQRERNLQIGGHDA